MTAELSPAEGSTPLTSVTDENTGIENGVVKSNGVLTELDRVSPSFYLKRDNMPSAFGLADQNGTTNGTDENGEVTTWLNNIFVQIVIVVCTRTDKYTHSLVVLFRYVTYTGLNTLLYLNVTDL